MTTGQSIINYAYHPDERKCPLPAVRTNYRTVQQTRNEVSRKSALPLTGKQNLGVYFSRFSNCICRTVGTDSVWRNC